MPFVLDASTAACWAFDDEGHPTAAFALELIRVDEAIVPGIWWFEIRNTLIVNERRGRIAEAYTASFLTLLASLDITLDTAPDEIGVLAFARRCRLSVYDAAYLELAKRIDAPLATLDAELAAAAKAEGVALIGT